MAIFERASDSVIDIYCEVIGNQGITLGSKEMQLVSEVFPFLRSHLCCLRGVRPVSRIAGQQRSDALTAGRAVILLPISCRSTASSLRFSLLSASES